MSSYQMVVAVTVGINIIVALGTFLPFSTGQMAAGQGAFVSIGAFTSAVATMLWGVPLIPALVLGGVVAAIAGAIIGVPTLRLRGIYFAIATLAFMMIVQVIAQTISYGHARDGRFLGINGPLGFETITYIKEHGIGTADFLILTAICVVFFVALLYLLERSRWGASLRAVEQNTLSAEAIGLDVARVRVLSFTLGAFIVGIGGGLYAHFITTISASDFGFGLSTLAIIYVVVGGRETFWGALLGAAVLGALPELLRFMADFRMEAYGALVVLVLLFRPRGLLDRELVAKIGRTVRRQPMPVLEEAPTGGWGGPRA